MDEITTLKNNLKIQSNKYVTETRDFKTKLNNTANKLVLCESNLKEEKKYNRNLLEKIKSKSIEQKKLEKINESLKQGIIIFLI